MNTKIVLMKKAFARLSKRVNGGKAEISERILSLFMDVVPMLMRFKDKDGTIFFASNRFCKDIFKKDVEQVIGHNINDLVSEDNISWYRVTKETDHVVIKDKCTGSFIEVCKIRGTRRVFWTTKTTTIDDKFADGIVSLSLDFDSQKRKTQKNTDEFHKMILEIDEGSYRIS
jgi:acid phosphatase class B